MLTEGRAGLHSGMGGVTPQQGECHINVECEESNVPARCYYVRTAAHQPAPHTQYTAVFNAATTGSLQLLMDCHLTFLLEMLIIIRIKHAGTDTSERNALNCVTSVGSSVFLCSFTLLHLLRRNV